MVNNDRSVTIANPSFADPPAAGKLPIDAHASSLNGVCRHFGLDRAQAWLRTEAAETGMGESFSLDSERLLIGG